MYRIIEGALYEGKLVRDSWEVRIWEANGHREISARNPVVWHEVAALSPTALEHRDEAIAAETEAEREAAKEERRQQALKKNAQRAKTMCRRVIKAEAFDELLTLTYRENQQDRALCKHHFAQWLRRMKKALPGFRFCASFEMQKRGAMHVHIATHKLPQHALYKGVKIEAWKLGTAVWRSVVGEDNGMCFVGGKTRHGGRRRNLSLAKMAAYVSKYILKDYEDAPEDTSRYSRSHGTVISKPVRLHIQATSLADLIGLAFHLGEGDVIVSHSASEDDGRYWLCTEPATRSG